MSDPFPTRIGWNIVFLEKYWSVEEQKRKELTENSAYYANVLKENRISELLRIRGEEGVRVDNQVVGKIRESIGKGLPFPSGEKTVAVATVYGLPVYMLEMEHLWAPGAGEAIETYLNSRIRDEILSREAISLGLDNQVARYLAMAEKRSVTRGYIKTVAAEMTPNQSEVETYYRNNPQKFLTEELRDLRVIETSDPAAAEEAAKLAREGKEFRSLAKKYNGDEKARDAEGKAGFVSRKMLAPEVAAPVFSAEEGNIVGPVAAVGQGGENLFAVVKIEGIRKPEVIPLERANREVIVQRILAGKMDGFYRDLFREVRESGNVEHIDNTQWGAGGK